MIETVRQSNEQGKSVIVIAIARKMARLFEYFRSNDARLQKIFEDKEDIQNILITEHAIPFCINKIEAVNNDVVVLDDLIVYGDTVVTVSEIIYYMTGIKPKVIAMAASIQSCKSYEYANLVYPDNRETDKISKEQFPAYTARNSWKIISLNKSIDIEHTILHVRGTFEDWTKKSEHIEQVLSENFPDATVYMVNHVIPAGGVAISASIVFPEEYAGKINDDFSKIRLYFGPNDILVTCYTPNFWDENLLKPKRALFNAVGSNEIWEEIREKLREIVPAENLSIPTLDKNRMDSYFRQRIEHTAVVAANYLVSFDSAMSFLPRLRQSLARLVEHAHRFCMSRSDLTWIFGPKLAVGIHERLQKNLESEFYVKGIEYRNDYIEDNKRDLPLIPENKLQDYMMRKRIDTYLSLNIPMALSLTFFRLWKDYGISKTSREDRIRVGESYESLYSTISLFFKKPTAKKDIHRWMDSSIDLGAVVPKYENFQNRLGLRVWRRIFRAGERESAMNDVAKAAMAVVGQLYDGKEQLSCHEFRNSVYPILQRLSREYPGQLDLQQFGEGIDFEKAEFDLPYAIWIYMIHVSGLKLKSDNSWSTVLLEDFHKADSALFMPN